MQDNELTYKLAFSMVKNIVAESATKILACLDNEPRRFFDAAESYLKREANLMSEIASKTYRDSLLEKARAEQKFISKKNIQCLYYTDSDYPQLLRECSDAPVMLYVIGNSNMNFLRPIAIVGTRHSTIYGQDSCTNFINEISEQISDIAIISGLAYGTDICAHRAALVAKTPTVAVLANPLDRIYPAEHRNDAVRIIREGGAIISETPTCGSVSRFSFLQRNRIIAGLSKVTIVIESDITGGSMSTARLAQEYNREVFALPGRNSDKYSRGCNFLIASERARLLHSIKSFAKDMRWPLRPLTGTQQELPLVLDDDESKIIKIIEQCPIINVNDLLRQAEMSYPALMELTLRMEMKNLIRMLPGNSYSLVN